MKKLFLIIALIFGIFKCANHNYSFDSTCETSNSLPCYSTNIEGDDLIVAT